MDEIILKGVKVHNLKNVDLTLKKNQLIVFTGVSGSGKSSLAFDTIYTEGQRRYIESLSHHARRYLGDLPKPDLKKAEGITPTIAIEQKLQGKSPRSTVGTLTGIYDFFRILFAKIGVPYCPISGEIVQKQSKDKILQKLEKLPFKKRIYILAPLARQKKGEFKEDFADLLKKGYTRVRINQEFIDLTEPIYLDKKKAHDIDIVIDRLVLSEQDQSRLKESAHQALEIGKGSFSIYDPDSDEQTLFSEHAYSPKSNLFYEPLNPQDFSFNHPKGMCEMCHGIGTMYEFDLEKIMDLDLSISEDCCLISSSYDTVRYKNIYDNLARIYGFSVKTPWKKLSKEAQNVFLYGTKKKWTEMRFRHPHKNTRWMEYVQWKGVLFEAHKRLIKATSNLYQKKMHALMTLDICPSCKGSRIKPYPSACKLAKKTLHDLTSLALDELLDFFQTLQLSTEEKKIAEELLKEIQKRITFLVEVGLGYLTLERISPTLSGGEAQRVRLASQIGSGLIGATYVLDEPSIGLHPQDHERLITALKDLRDLGNTVIVVEHDPDTIQAADIVVDVGPLAGKKGGEILSCSSLSDLLKNKRSLTGKYLSKKLEIKTPKKRRKLKKALKIIGATHHNLKNIDVSIPLGGLICVTGVSGSGKSSLISDILFPALSRHYHRSEQKVGKHKKIEGLENLDKVIGVDQSPIGRTPRSNPATYIKLFDPIRDLFADLPESKVRGYQKGHFSFNVKVGSCPYCGGAGSVKVDMDFMEDVYSLCPECKGKRFEPEILQIHFRGKNIFDVLEMDVESALDHFENMPTIYSKLKILDEVGLGYLSLGQPSPTLSGGEAQRIKLAKELLRPSTGKTLYILDEPTTGLHFYDMQKLLLVLERLIGKNNSILVIEHNMEFVKTADWIIEMGPKAGKNGGELILTGTPEKVMKSQTPTAKALRKELSFKKSKRAKKKKSTKILIEKAAENNLKEVDFKINTNEITIFTGPSGSGKTSLAIDTIYAEGQRRYIESLSSYIKQFVKLPPKPKVERIENLSASIAIEQGASAVNPRSTLGTLTEIYDLIRVLYAHIGTPFCPETNEPIKTISKEFVVKKILESTKGSKLYILAPIQPFRSETFSNFLNKYQSLGYLRIRLNHTYYELDDTIPYHPNQKNEIFLVIDRLIANPNIEKRLYEAVENAAVIGNNTLTVEIDEKDHFFNLAFAVEKTGKSYPPITPQTFSFNAQAGMCLDCQGIGTFYGLSLLDHPEMQDFSILEILQELLKNQKTKQALSLIEEYFDHFKIDPYEPLCDLPPSHLNTFLHGADEKMTFERKNLLFHWKGLEPLLASAAKSANSAIKATLIPLMHENTCPTCMGSRLNPLARAVKIKNLTIGDFCALPIKKVYDFVKTLQNMLPKYLIETHEDLLKYLEFLIEIGLDYLSLDRSAPTLSGGELQRIRLARQLGCSLTSCIYVLDEPTIGLHPHNNHLLNQALIKLKNLGNTLILVEHEPMTLEIADQIVDFGPEAGRKGGKIVATGTYEQILKNKKSLTGAYLSGRKTIPIPEKRKKNENCIRIQNASIHNLKNVSVDIPLSSFTCITGVSGSGKSSLMHYVLKPAVQKHLKQKSKTIKEEFFEVHNLDFDKLIVIDQNVMKVSHRSDVASYSDTLAAFRFFYASLKLAKAKGLKPIHFSYHHKKGMCKNCWGLGYKTIDLQFMPAVKVTCEVCHGYKLNPRTLEILYREKNLGHALNMTVEEAKEHFCDIAPIVRKLNILISTGLGYLKLGQQIYSLSGGEAQRIRLSRELNKRATGKTLYLIDEPTVGLHFEDIAKLLPIFHKLVKKKNTIIAIEHNLEFISNADTVIDIGPDAGEMGGKIICVGTPEKVAQHKTSYTGKYLKKILKNNEFI